MKEILKMIEEVDPSDTAKLDEIDARVWCCLMGCRFESMNHPYTRSRDALKAIRPEGWRWWVSQQDDNAGTWNAGCQQQHVPYHVMLEGGFKTEELAELHAILQAIQCERDNANL